MFTGIIEQMAKVEEITARGNNLTFHLSSPLSGELKPDQSLSHNGVCLTVEHADERRHTVTAVEETLQKTNLGSWKKGTLVNLERCLTMNGRLDGHLVQGHVDTVGQCLRKEERNGSHLMTFGFNPSFSDLVIEKGSIAINGISLTCFDVQSDRFSVAIVPYTYDHTNMCYLLEGDPVNIEFDMMGKYVSKILASKMPS
jgi:riboflavin synthase